MRLGRPVVLDASKMSPAVGTSLRPSTTTGVLGPASLIGVAFVVEHGLDAAPGGADDDGIAPFERAVLHQQRGV